MEMDLKLFDKYDVKEVKVKDPGLKKYLKVDGKLMVKSHGRKRDKFERADINILERLANIIAVPGHRGKKHKVQTNWSTGKYYKNMKVVLETLEILKNKVGKNPIEILIRAIENAAPCNETTTIEYGGARYPRAVDTSPLRRLNIALKHLVHGGYDNTFKKKGTVAEGLAEEILLAYNNKRESNAIMKRYEAEKQADSAR